MFHKLNMKASLASFEEVTQENDAHPPFWISGFCKQSILPGFERMVSCSATGCSNSSRKGFRLFRFPSDLKRREKWRMNCRRDNWKPTDNSRLCEIHFEVNQFESSRQDGWKKLKPDAVPTIFDQTNLSPKSSLQNKKPILPTTNLLTPVTCTTTLSPTTATTTKPIILSTTKSVTPVTVRTAVSPTTITTPAIKSTCTSTSGAAPTITSETSTNSFSNLSIQTVEQFSKILIGKDTEIRRLKKLLEMKDKELKAIKLFLYRLQISNAYKLSRSGKPASIVATS